MQALRAERATASRLFGEKYAAARARVTENLQELEEYERLAAALVALQQLPPDRVQTHYSKCSALAYLEMQTPPSAFVAVQLLQRFYVSLTVGEAQTYLRARAEVARERIELMERTAAEIKLSAALAGLEDFA